MSFAVEIDPQAAEALEESRSSGGGSFPPLPKGPYQATVVPLKKDGDRMKVEEWGGSGPNKAKKVLRVAVKIVPESPTGANRTFFLRVPLFTRFAPKDGAAVGKPARMYFSFFGAVGVSDADLAAGKLPGPDQILGKRVEVVLGEPQVPDEWNPLGKSEVNFVNRPGSIDSTPRRQPGVPVAPWLDENDNLIEGAVPGQAPQAAATQPSVNPWATPAAAEEPPQQGIQPGAWAQAASY